MSNKLLGGSFLLAKDHKLMHMLHEFWREPSLEMMILSSIVVADEEL
jgi:hypothetical protein